MIRPAVRRFLILALALLLPPLARGAEPAAEKHLYDFEAADDAKAWSPLVLPGAKEQEPPVKIDLSTEGSASGKHSLKLTFAGGLWPTATTAQISQDWLAFKTFKATVTVGRPCVVGFTLLQEKSRRGDGWDPAISRWTTTAFLHAGKNEVVASLLSPNDYAVHAKWGKAVRFEIFMYAPHAGESIFVDAIRLSPEKLAAAPAADRFAIEGTEWSVTGNGAADACRQLGRNLSHLWARPEPLTIAGIEADFRARHEQFKKRYPKAAFAILRDGETGYDPAHPERVYAGWKDAYWTSHGPASDFAERAKNRGASASHEVFMRHRSPLMRLDLASIPAGSNILAAQLVLVRTSEKVLDDHDPGRRPNMWVAQPCNRPWAEYEVNAFQYAKDRFWRDIGGMSRGDDPDFLPRFLAFGPGRPGKVNAWDFTHAVRFWTDGKQANRGFMLHGDAGDYMIAHTREARELRDRPAVFVIYVPK